MNANWHRNLTKYWFKIELETKQILRMVKDDFHSSGISFDDNFKDYFVQTTNIRIAQVYEQCLTEFRFEEQFIGVRFGQVPAANPIEKTTAVANDEMDVIASRPATVDSILNGMHVPSDESVASFLFKHNRPGNVTSTVKALFSNVTVSATRIDPNPSTDANGSDQNKDDDANYFTQRENGMMPAVNMGELANEVMANRSTIDPIAPTSIGQSNTTAFWPQGLPTSTPFHGFSEEPEMNAPRYASFLPIASIMDENIDPNNVTSTIDVMLGNASRLTAQIDQSQAIDAIETEPSEANDGSGISGTANGTTSPDATGPVASDLDDINMMDVLQIEPIDIELPNDTIVGDNIGIDEVTLAEEQAASSARINESTNRVAKCIDLICDDVEPSPEVDSDQSERNAVRHRGNQRRKRKIVDVTTSDGSAKKRRKTGLRSTLKTIPESNSEVALIDLTLNDIESSEQTSSMSSQPVQEDGADSNGVKKPSASTSNAKQVAKKKGSVGKSGGEGGSKGHKCAFCEYTAPSGSKLVIHTRIHTADKPFKCEVCATGFTQKSNLKGHMKTHANDFPFHCSICRQGFKVKKAKEAHKKSCNPRRFECYLCKYSTLIKPNLVLHMRTHTGDKPFKCEMCARGFTVKNSLANHMTTHAKDFPFHCSICRQGFKVKKAKEAHEKSCDQRRYECYLCKYSTLIKRNLVTHMRKHTGDKPFRCSHCSERFAVKCNLNRHLERHHNKTK